MALYKYHYIELDTKRSPRISLQNIVAGETGNRIWVTVTNNGSTIDMSEKSNGEFIYRVCLKIDSDLGTRRQDSAQENSGITFIEAATGDHGKINILLSKDSFTAGMNRARIEIFSKRAEDNDTLIISAEWTFRAAGNPTGENAGSVYPSLIELENELNQLIDDAEDAIEDCEDATEAANAAATAANNAATSANNAASAANSAASAANAAATDATNAANAAWIRVDACNIALANVLAATTAANNAASSANDAAADADNAAQEAYTRGAAAGEAASSANAAAAAATAAAAAATEAAKKNLVLVKHDADWVSDTGAHGSTSLTATELRAMMPDSIFAIQIKGVNYASDNSVITLIESFRDDESNMIYFRTSESVDKRMYVGSMDIDATGSAKGIVDVNILPDDSLLMLHVDEMTINDEDEITSISFRETSLQIYEAIGVRPLEVIVVNDDKNYRLREWVDWEETIDPQPPSPSVVNRYAELTAQNVISRESVYLRIHAQKGSMSYTVSGTGAFSTRG